jgi:hypothetical protein
MSDANIWREEPQRPEPFYIVPYEGPSTSPLELTEEENQALLPCMISFISDEKTNIQPFRVMRRTRDASVQVRQKQRPN